MKKLMNLLITFVLLLSIFPTAQASEYMTVYTPDGRKQLVLEREAPAWKAVGWDFQTGYADNIPRENDSSIGR